MPGRNLQLTIDVDLQKIAEEELANNKFAGAVVTIEVNTGRLLVSASSPPLHLQDFVGGISKANWKAMLDTVEKETKERFAQEFPESEKDISGLIFTITKECMRSMILDEGVRIDDRKLDEIRPIWCETKVLPRDYEIGRASCRERV